MTDTQNVPAKPPAQLSQMDMMRTTITKLEAEFANALPPQIPVQKFIRTTITALQMNPQLLECDRRSVLGACMKAAQDGLLVDGREAALVIFRGKQGPAAQYMPMIGGLLKKLRNSGELASIAANVAYEKDVFEYELGDNERIRHLPFLGKERGNPVAAYAIAKTKDGAIYRDVMPVDEIEQVRSVSRARDNGPWVAWWGEMAKKTVLRRLMKRLPSSADLDRLIANDNETNDLAPQVLAGTPESPATGSPSRLRASIGLDQAAEVSTAEPVDYSDVPFDEPQGGAS